MPKDPIKHSKNTPKRIRCSQRNSRKYREAKRLWDFMHPAKKITPAEKGALIYLGEPLRKDSE